MWCCGLQQGGDNRCRLCTCRTTTDARASVSAQRLGVYHTRPDRRLNCTPFAPSSHTRDLLAHSVRVLLHHPSACIVMARGVRWLGDDVRLNLRVNLSERAIACVEVEGVDGAGMCMCCMWCAPVACRPPRWFLFTERLVQRVRGVTSSPCCCAAAAVVRQRCNDVRLRMIELSSRDYLLLRHRLERTVKTRTESSASTSSGTRRRHGRLAACFAMVHLVTLH